MTGQTFEPKFYSRWQDVPNRLGTRGQWRKRGRRVRKREAASAHFEIVTERRLTTVETSTRVIKRIALYHIDQTAPSQLTPLERAKQLYSQYFVATAEKTKHIKRCKGGYTIDAEGERYWDDRLPETGWRQIKDVLSQSRVDSHLSGREELGIYGGAESSHLLIDLDLHNVPLTLFRRRLDILLDHLHGQHRCHVQVSEENARGVHLILFFGRPSPLETRRRWILNVLRKLDEQYSDALLTQGAIRTLPVEQRQGVRPIEIYPDSRNGHRLPLAKNRIVLLDKPLFPIWRQGALRQDVVGYIDWLSDCDRQYMPKQDVLSFVDNRLDISCAADDGISVSGSISNIADHNCEISSSDKAASNGSLRGKTRAALTALWLRSELGPFQHLNSGIWTTLQAMHAQGVERSQAVQIVSQFVGDLPDQSISSRLPNKKHEIDDQIRRMASKAWRAPVSSRWEAAASHWSKAGFLVADKATWTFERKKLTAINLPDIQIDFNNEEKLLIIEKLAPVIFGEKQANKPEKQEELFRAMAYFLRYVKGCDREIPQTALPVILSDFNLKLRKNGKAGAFLRCLVEDMGWLYIAADYDHPLKVGGGTCHRATRYGIGQPVAYKFSSSSSALLNYNTPHRDLYTVSPFLGGDELIGEISCYEEQLEALWKEQWA